jgi:hypothetical protein
MGGSLELNSAKGFYRELVSDIGPVLRTSQSSPAVDQNNRMTMIDNYTKM